jgi:hypothetical protein
MEGMSSTVSVPDNRHQRLPRTGGGQREALEKAKSIILTCSVSSARSQPGD